MGVPNPPVARRLSARDREVLWMMSQGMTYFEVGRRLGMSEGGAKSASRRAMHKLGARNIVHAVAVALLRGEIGRWKTCGTHAAYQRHRRLHHTADPACLVAKAEYDRGYRAADSWTGLVKIPHTASLDEVYRRSDTGKTIRIESIDSDGLRADAVDVRTGRPTRVLTSSLYPDRWNKYGTERRSGYVRISWRNDHGRNPEPSQRGSQGPPGPGGPEPDRSPPQVERREAPTGRAQGQGQVTDRT